ncbi:hypothetical protein [uncultured Paludibaculum sp.]|uniref:hypothetical protein n=1 Tax=uncultured Paludibaculum sp. TaxID=1765020 RepID=UPI002AABEEC2|nr:hypothetical protein [uncultured Paludibaculum sp.]
MRRTLLVYIFLSALACHAAEDPFIGKWTLNASKTKYPKSVPLPKSMSITMEPAGGQGSGIHYRSEISFQDGKFPSGKTSAGAVLISDYTADYSGTPVVVVTNGGVTTPVSLKRLSERTVVATYARENIVLATSTRVVSKDGQTMTVTTISKDKSGKNVTTVGVYQKVQ